MQCWLFSGEESFFGGVTFSWHGGDAPWPAGVRVVNIDLPPDDRLGPDGLRLEAQESGQVVGWRLVDHDGEFLASGDPSEQGEDQREWLALRDRRLSKGQLASEEPGQLDLYFCARVEAAPEQIPDVEPVPEQTVADGLAQGPAQVDYHLELLGAGGEVLPESMDGEEPEALYTLDKNWSGQLVM